ncbi:MAG: carboxypeptidase regulatory-like domain-containing protein, partial [Candidatus Zixiibacteriota bacterium]
MRNCPICNSEQSAENPKSCFQCGYLFDKNAGFSSDTPNDNKDDLDFTISEANDDEREFVGGNKSSFNNDMDNTISETNEDEQELEKENKASLNMEETKDDDLNIETTTDLMEKEAQSVIQNKTTNLNDRPIAPPPPLMANPSDLSIEKTGNNINESETSINTNKTGKVKILSQDEIKKIEQNLYKSDNFLSDKEKKDIIKNIDKDENKPFSNTPITPPKVEHKENKIIEEPKSNLPKPKISKKSKGIAYFYKQYIQLAGNQVLFINDEILVNNREYILKPKKIKMSLLIGAGALSFALILFIVGSLFISDVNSGKGQLVGVVLDKNGKPNINGATVRIKELGKTIITNPQGFFKLDGIPIGTQQIEYIINDDVVKVDFATISDNQISMIFLRPENEKKHIKKYTKPKLTQKSKKNNISKKTPVYTKKNSSSKTSNSKKNKKTATLRKKKTSSPNYTNYSKITLAANIDGAKLAIDGSVLGAGNLTFSKIKSGNHKYVVSLDGYSPIKGFINLSPGENKKLKVT